MAATGADEEILQYDYHSEILIASWVLFGISTLFVFVRFASRKKFARLESGDILLPLALVLTSVQTLCVQFAVDNGLGRQYSIQVSQTIDKVYKLVYWAQLLYILILGVTKATIALLILPLDIPRPLSIASFIVCALICTSTIALLFGTAFQCQLPQPWLGISQPKQCINLSAFWQAVSIITIITDLLAISLPMAAVLIINLNRKSQIFVGALFASRLIVPALVVVVFVLRLRLDDSSSPFYDAAVLQIWMQAVINISVVTACIPPLGTIFADVAIGFTKKRMVPTSIHWGRYSPPEMTRVTLDYEARPSRQIRSPDKVPLFSDGNLQDGSYSTVNMPRSNSFSWVDLETGSRYMVTSDGRRLGSRGKQVHFVDFPPPTMMPMLPPSNHYPDTEVRSTTLDILSDYTYNWHPGRFENPTMPPPPVPPVRSTFVNNSWPEKSLHKRGTSSISAQSRISEPSFVFSSTLVTPYNSRRDSSSIYRNRRSTRSSGSLRSARSSYGKRESVPKKHRSTQSLSILPSYLSWGSSRWSDAFIGPNATIYEESSQFGSGSFVNVDEEFDRCRRLQDVRVHEETN